MEKLAPVAETNTKATKKPKKNKAIREISALLLWSYVFVNTLIFDVDAWLLTIIPSQFHWLIQYKFLLVLFTIILLFLFQGWKSLFLNISFVATYPYTFPFRYLWKAIKRNNANQKKNAATADTPEQRQKALSAITIGVSLIPIVRRFFMKFRQRIAAL